MIGRTIWRGDNLLIMRGMESESVDLIYLDPPFNSKNNYTAPIGSKTEQGAFKDTWTLSDVDIAWTDEIKKKTPDLYSLIIAISKTGDQSDKSYLIYMAVRIIEMHRLLKSTGSIYLHCDFRMSHSLKLMMDCIFGKNNFWNEIVWKSTNSSKIRAKTFGSPANSIFLYTKSSDFIFNKIYRAHDEKSLKPYRYDDNDGRGKYRVVEIVAHGIQNMKKRKWFEFLGMTAPYLYKLETLQKWHKEGIIYTSKNGRLSKKQYLNDVEGVLVSDIWVDNEVSPIQSKETMGYPTQKKKNLWLYWNASLKRPAMKAILFLTRL